MDKLKQINHNYDKSLKLLNKRTKFSLCLFTKNQSGSTRKYVFERISENTQVQECEKLKNHEMIIKNFGKQAQQNINEHKKIQYQNDIFNYNQLNSIKQNFSNKILSSFNLTISINIGKKVIYTLKSDILMIGSYIATLNMQFKGFKVVQIQKILLIKKLINYQENFEIDQKNSLSDQNKQKTIVNYKE